MSQNVEDIYELSPLQSGILFHTLYAPGSGVYVVQFHCILQGKLDVLMFQRAWQWTVEQHPVLRTAFLWEDLEKPLQIVFHQVDLPWTMDDWSAMDQGKQEEYLKRFLQEERERGFSLALAPLFRLSLIRIGEARYHFIWSFHHLILDGWSHVLIMKDVLNFYARKEENLNQPRAMRVYKEYILWLQQQDLGAAEIFWRHTLHGFTTPLSLGHDRARIPGVHSQQKQYQEQQTQLPPSTTTALQRLAQKHGLTLNTIIQGAWALLLSHISGEQDIVFGSVSSGRSVAIDSIDMMVGLFINTLPMRVLAQDSFHLLSWLHTIQNRQLEMQQYEYVSLTQIHRWSAVPLDVPLFETLFIFENYPLETSLTDKETLNVSVEEIHVYEKISYPLNAIVIPGIATTMRIAYNGEYFEEKTIETILTDWETLLEEFWRNPERPLSDFLQGIRKMPPPIPSEWSTSQMVSPTEDCIHQLFQKQAIRTPTHIAVAFQGQKLTYKELDEQSDQLACYLRQLGVEPEQLVGIYLSRSIAMIIALLGVLKAGGAYLPLDPAYPQERISFITRDARVNILLTEQQYARRLPVSSDIAHNVYLDTLWTGTTSTENTPCINRVTADNLAYVIYTSGSTGRPKGVSITHRSAVTLLTWAEHFFLPEDLSGVLAATSLCFDLSVFEIFAPLSRGGTVILAEDVLHLAHIPEKNAVTLLNIVPSVAAPLVQTGAIPASVKTILLAGEPLHRWLVQRIYEYPAIQRVVNLYGPTEDTTYSTYAVIEPGSGEPPIGRPLTNTQVYILDPHMKAVPLGSIGELYLGGDGLARGYLHAPDLTAERFVPNPYGLPGTRLYRTGDLVCFTKNGELRYCGRIDRQVKVRGFRIELAEIESVLSSHPTLREGVVLVKEDKHGDKQLAAYLVPQDTHAHESEALTEEVRSFLRQKLPSYMIPATFILLPAIPALPNGKVDYQMLLLAEQPQSRKSYVPPTTDEETMIALIWQEILQIEQVGIHENFFDIGGHSLLALRAHDRLKKMLQRDFPLVALFEHPTISTLAAYLVEQKEGDISLKGHLSQSITRAMSRREGMQRQIQRRQVHRAEHER